MQTRTRTPRIHPAPLCGVGGNRRIHLRREHVIRKRPVRTIWDDERIKCIQRTAAHLVALVGVDVDVGIGVKFRQEPRTLLAGNRPGIVIDLLRARIHLRLGERDLSSRRVAEKSLCERIGTVTELGMARRRRDAPLAVRAADAGDVADHVRAPAFVGDVAGVDAPRLDLCIGHLVMAAEHDGAAAVPHVERALLHPKRLRTLVSERHGGHRIPRRTIA